MEALMATLDDALAFLDVCEHQLDEAVTVITEMGRDPDAQDDFSDLRAKAAAGFSLLAQLRLALADVDAARELFAGAASQGREKLAIVRARRGEPPARVLN
jgi:hypothetical protein